MAKTAVYRWRLHPDLKRRLARTARAEKTSIDGLLDRIAREWLADEPPLQNAKEMRRLLRADAAQRLGPGSPGKGPCTRVRIREQVGTRLMEKYRWPRHDAPCR